MLIQFIFGHILAYNRAFEDISIFSNGGHLGYRTALMDTF